MRPVSLDFADGEYDFQFSVDNIDELQEKCNAGPPVIFNRLVSSSFRQEDFRETIRIGLIGGGETAAKALSLVRRYVDEKPALENVQIAQAILGAWLFGLEDVIDEVNEGLDPDPKTETPTEK